MQNLKNVRMPQGNAPGRLAGLIIGGGALLYGVSNSLFNVEGGHRAIVFNRVGGIKERVRPRHLGTDCQYVAYKKLSFSVRCMRKVLTLCFRGSTGRSYTMFVRALTSFKARQAPRICKW